MRNQRYARCHRYGFAYVHHASGFMGCSHATRGRLSPYWCKIAAMAHVLLHGINGRACDNLVFLDSDVHLVNSSMSLDAYLDRARAIGDEALSDDAWQMLFTSNAPHVPSGLCTGIFFVRRTADACGILRNWWNVDWTDTAKWAWEQGAMAEGVHAYHRAYGARVRVMPTSRSWHLNEIPKLRKSAHCAKMAAPHDPLFHHRCQSITGARKQDTHGNCAPPATSADNIYVPLQATCRARARTSKAHVISLADAGAVFPEEHDARCPPAAPRRGVVLSTFMSDKLCCRGGVLHPSLTSLNGSQSAARRPCWEAAPNANRERWTCWPSDTAVNAVATSCRGY